MVHNIHTFRPTFMWYARHVTEVYSQVIINDQSVTVG